ncbi:MAG: DUF1592 domain-containing protein [Porticoccaceae bacterium]|nr:DUF1592 domain-containing protein [Porticoccaceae bacterium]
MKNRNSFKKRSARIAVLLFGLVALLGGGYLVLGLLEGEPVHAGPPTVKLINQSQYANTIAYVFGEDISVPPQFPPVNRIDGLLALGSANTAITPGVVERFYRYGNQIARQVMEPGRREYLVPCNPANAEGADAQCATLFIEQVGRLLYRRALQEEEVSGYVTMAGSAADTVNDFYLGLTYVLTAMLASSEFVLIADRLEDVPGKPEQHRLDGYSKASRLSFFLWNSSPDEQLLEAAESGELHDRAGLERQVERMLSAPKYRESIRGFFADMLQFDEFENLAKDSLIYPAYSPSASEDAAEQILRMITHHLVDLRGDYRDIFTTRKTYMSNALGALYQVPVDPGVDFVPYEFPRSDSRAGLLSHVGFLSLHSHPGRSSPTVRGVGVRESLLCQPVPLPPPNVDFSNFEDPAGEFKTARERLVRHSSDAACANCHMITDPVGLGLENFDGAGQFRTTENGVVIDVSGELDGIPFHDPATLGEAVRNNPATTACLVERMFAHSINRQIQFEDRTVVERLEKRFSKLGYRVPELMRNIALDEAFFAVSLEEESAAEEIVSVH